MQGIIIIFLLLSAYSFYLRETNLTSQVLIIIIRWKLRLELVKRLFSNFGYKLFLGFSNYVWRISIICDCIVFIVSFGSICVVFTWTFILCRVISLSKWDHYGIILILLLIRSPVLKLNMIWVSFTSKISYHFIYLLDIIKSIHENLLFQNRH